MKKKIVLLDIMFEHEERLAMGSQPKKKLVQDLYEKFNRGKCCLVFKFVNYQFRPNIRIFKTLFFFSRFRRISFNS